jgi:succinyl-CoA synthetase beta subunit
MKIYEHQAKRLLAEYGITVPRGSVATSPEAAGAVAADLGTAVVIKAQVLVGGRGKAGGVRVARTRQEAETLAEVILGLRISGLPVRSVLVEEALAIQRELYLSISVDRAAGQPLILASGLGGVDIEEVARTDPDAISRLRIDPCTGLRPYHTLSLAQSVGLARGQFADFDRVVRGVYTALWSTEATLVEINPLVVTDSGGTIAVDAKMVLDDNALFRHPELSMLRPADEESAAERQAREAGISYVRLGGDIGCLVNGAGLAMATMDAVMLMGGAPANFLDIGGGARADTVSRALQIILSDRRVKVLLLNIFGGITRCDEVAAGLVDSLDAVATALPVVARLVGTNEAEGRAILEASGLRVTTATELSEAVETAILAARAQRDG